MNHYNFYTDTIYFHSEDGARWLPYICRIRLHVCQINTIGASNSVGASLANSNDISHLYIL